ncbi:MAG TPA: TIR domain-containing protein, partial [Ktedonobacterales bacterium]
MVSRRSRASSSTRSGGGRSFWAWLALGWLCVVAWLALLAFNAAPYFGGRAWPSVGVALPGLIALPAALSLPPAVASPAAWIVAGVACFLLLIVTALTISPGPRAGAVKRAEPIQAPPTPRVAPPSASSESPAPMSVSVADDTAPTALPARIADSIPPAAAASTPAIATPTTRRPRVFISHSSADNHFGLELERRLKLALGDDDDVFYDSDGGLRGGDEWLKRLQYEIGQRDVFVLILSPQARDSGWVEMECNYALTQAVSIGGKVIVPVLHRETPTWPFIDQFQMVDFLEPAHFEAAFADLLDAVRLGRSRKAELRGLRGVRRGPPF